MRSPVLVLLEVSAGRLSHAPTDFRRCDLRATFTDQDDSPTPELRHVLVTMDRATKFNAGQTSLVALVLENRPFVLRRFGRFGRFAKSQSHRLKVKKVEQ